MSIKYYDSAVDDLAALAACYEKKGDYAQALAYHKQYSLESEQVTKERSKKSLNENELKINLLSKEKELDKQRAQHNLSILAALIALLLVGLLSFFYYRQRKVKNILQKQNALINQQSEALRHLDAAKTRFFANVSHELRTPLTLMLAPLSTMIKSGTLDNKNFTLAGLVKQNTQGLLKLVNEILDLNKLEAGKLVLHEEKTVVYNLIRRIMAGFESAAEARQIHFTFQYQADRYLQLMLDTDKFEKIVNNLLSNALKFTPTEGAITVVVKDLHNQLHIDITDTGRGIHPDDLPHIFNRFYQSNQPDAAIEGGTGIGLSLSMELARLFGGTLAVKSTLGAGSTFVFELPKKEVLGSIQTQDAEEMAQELILTEDIWETSNLVATPTTNIENKTKRTVLIVEDNQSLRDYLSLILEPYYTIFKAENGKVALEMMNQLPQATTPHSSFIIHQSSLKKLPDLILSDVMMPIMDGFQLLSVLKTSDVFCSIPVVMLTARAEMQDKLKALRIGVDDYLTKPFEEEELLVRIENLLKNAKVRQKIRQEELIETGTAGSENFESSTNLTDIMPPSV